MVRLSKFLPISPLQREVSQRHACFFAQLEERQTLVEVDGQTLFVNLVEHWPAVVLVHQLAKPPHEFRSFWLRPHRISHGDPGTAVFGIHDECRG